MEQQVTSNVAEIVFRHAAAVQAGQLEAVMQDFTEESAIITNDQSFHGLAEISAFWQGVFRQYPVEVLKAITPIRYEVYQDILYLTYQANPVLKPSCDTFLVRDGKIMVQTIFMVF